MCVCGVYFLFGYISYYFYKSFPPPSTPLPPARQIIAVRSTVIAGLWLDV